MLDMLLLPENICFLQDMLKCHIMSGAIVSADFVTGEYATLQGSDVTVEVSETGMKVEYAEVQYPYDIVASNGIFHVIDAVLLPPVTGVTAEVPVDDVLATEATPTNISFDPAPPLWDEQPPRETKKKGRRFDKELQSSLDGSYWGMSSAARRRR